MPKFSVSATRLDPYKNFKFRILWEGSLTPVAGISKVRGLRRGGAKHGGRVDPRTLGETPWEAITLERGVTYDPEFEKWAEVSSKHVRRNLIINMYNELGQLAIRYKVHRCWVSEFRGQPDLDAKANAVAIQSIKLGNEGWELDHEVSERSKGTSVEPQE